MHNPTPSALLNSDSQNSLFDKIFGSHGATSAPVGGTVTSVAETFTGGLISVAGSPITTSGTLALTVAGTSGGLVFFSDATHWASTGALTANALLLGGGAGSAPTTLALGTQYQVPQINAAGTANEYTSWPVDDTTIDVGETLTIPAGFSKMMAGPLAISGTLSISGRMVLN